MELHQDAIDLLRALNAESAEYLIVGGYAFGYHGRPRFTKDFDLFIGTDPANAGRVWAALRAFGAPLSGLEARDLAQDDTFFIIGRPPNQIDVITTIDGVDFQEAWSRRLGDTFQGVNAWFIGRDDLITNKVAAGRPQDLADVAYLRGEDD